MRAEIYVQLLNEGTWVCRLVEAEHVRDDVYRITGVNADPKDEEWEFRTGAMVRCTEKATSAGSVLLAIEEVAS